MTAEAISLYISVYDAAGRCSLHHLTIRRAISAGELPAYKFGRALRVKVPELDQWAASKAIPNARIRRKAG